MTATNSPSAQAALQALDRLGADLSHIARHKDSIGLLRQFIEGAERTHKLQQRAMTALQEAMCMLSEFDHRTVLRGEDKAQMLQVINDLSAARSAEQKDKE